MGQLATALEGEDGSILQGDTVPGDQGCCHLVAVVFGLGQGQGGLVAEALDVQCGTRADVGEALGDLRGAGSLVGAAQVDVAFLFLDEGGGAGGTLGGHHEGPLGAVAGVLDGGDDLGDDVAGLAQDHEVADEDALAGDLLGVVQGRARDVGSGDQHGIHDAVGGDPAGAPHLDADIEQARVDLLGRELVGGRPAGGPRGGPQGALEGQVVDLDDDAVDLVVEAVSLCSDLRDPFLDGLAPGEQASVGRDGQAPVAQLLVPALLGGRLGESFPCLDEADAVGDHRKGALGGLGRVLLAQGTGGRVARVHEGLLAGGHPGLVECCEVGNREVDLATHLDAPGCGSCQRLRDGGDCSRVRGDVFADVAVASGGGAQEASVLVEEVDGEAIDLHLGRHLEVRDARGFGHAGLPPGEFLEGEHVVEGHHLGEVADLGEGGVDATAHAHRGRISAAQLRVAFLDLLDLAVHAVVVGVRDGGRVPVVVGGARLLDAPDELVVAFPGGLERGVRHGDHCRISLPRGAARSPVDEREVAMPTGRAPVVHRGLSPCRLVHRRAGGV